jgi:cytochrome-b5 reductase
MHSLQPGDSLTVRGPIPGYGYKPSLSQPRSVVLVAGGAGITPIYSLAREILTNDAKDQTAVQLLWGVNGSRDIVLRRELEALEAQFPTRLRVTYAVSGNGPEERDGEKYRKGYVDRKLVEEAIAKCGPNFGDEKGTKVFLCGPPKMEDAVAGKNGVLAELGLAKKEIHRF